MDRRKLEELVGHLAGRMAALYIETTMKKLSALLILLAATSFSACSFFDFGSAEDMPPLTEEQAERTAPPAAAAPSQRRTTPKESAALDGEGTSTVEVLWQVPPEAVERYHLYYGLDPAKLDNHIALPVTEIEKIDHPKHGPVYRYELKQIPAIHPIFLSLRAENKFGMSEMSQPTRIEPGQKTVTP